MAFGFPSQESPTYFLVLCGPTIQPYTSIAAPQTSSGFNSIDTPNHLAASGPHPSPVVSKRRPRKAIHVQRKELVELPLADTPAVAGSSDLGQPRPAPWPWPFPQRNLKQDEDTLPANIGLCGATVSEIDTEISKPDPLKAEHESISSQFKTLPASELVALKMEEDLSPVIVCPDQAVVSSMANPTDEIDEIPLHTDTEPSSTLGKLTAISNSCSRQLMQPEGSSEQDRPVSIVTKHNTRLPNILACRPKHLGVQKQHLRREVPIFISCGLSEETANSSPLVPAVVESPEKTQVIQICRQTPACKTYSRTFCHQKSRVVNSPESTSEKVGQLETGATCDSRPTTLLIHARSAAKNCESLQVSDGPSHLDLLKIDSVDIGSTAWKNADSKLDVDQCIDADKQTLPCNTQAIQPQFVCHHTRVVSTSTYSFCPEKSGGEQVDGPQACDPDAGTDWLCKDCGVICQLQQVSKATGYVPYTDRNLDHTKFCCVLCEATLPTKSALSKHLATHVQLNRYTCNVCKLEFFNRPLMERHATSKHDAEWTKFDCKPCNLTFPSWKKVAVHFTNVHSQDEEDERLQEAGENNGSLKCVRCFQELEGQDSLIRHLKTHVKEEIRVVRAKKPKSQNDGCLCSLCGKVYPNSSGLVKHMQSHEGYCKKGHVCPLCNVKLKSADELQDHLRETKHEYRCPTCGAQSKTKQCLASHTKSHTMKATLQCHICFKMFKIPPSLRRHLLTHSGETPFQCSFCPMLFSSSWNCRTHERLHTGEKRFKCEVCGKAFTHNVSKKNHMKYHSVVPGVATVQPRRSNKGKPRRSIPPTHK